MRLYSRIHTQGWGFPRNMHGISTSRCPRCTVGNTWECTVYDENIQGKLPHKNVRVALQCSHVHEGHLAFDKFGCHRVKSKKQKRKCQNV